MLHWFKKMKINLEGNFYWYFFDGVGFFLREYLWVRSVGGGDFLGRVNRIGRTDGRRSGAVSRFSEAGAGPSNRADGRRTRESFWPLWSSSPWSIIIMITVIINASSMHQHDHDHIAIYNNSNSNRSYSFQNLYTTTNKIYECICLKLLKTRQRR